MHLARAGIAHHLDDLHAGGAANDRIVDQDDALAVDQRRIGVVLQLDAEVADFLARLDEGPADIVRADDPELERNARCLAEADRRGNAAVGDRDDIIGLDRRLARQLGADVLADFVDRLAVGDRVGPREIDMLEDARPRRRPCRTAGRSGCPMPLTTTSSPGSTSRRKVAPMTSSATRFRREDRRFAELAHDQRPDARAGRGRRSARPRSGRAANKRPRPACSASVSRSRSLV